MLYTPNGGGGGGGGGVARRDPAHVTPKVKLCMQTMFYVCLSKGLSCKSSFLAFFGPDIKIEMSVVIYILKIFLRLY